MRRLGAALLAVLVAAGAALVAAGAGGGGGDRYRVDAIFDNAGFLIPGQDVKIAGAKVGSVTAVALTPERRARVSMEVDARFGPFRSDADCTIQPQSLIGEKYVQCAPGTPRGRPLSAVGGGVPTVAVERTHAPIDVDLVLAALRRPAPERLSILVAELGGGVAGRGGDLSATIRRANPALQQTARVLRILDADRRRLAALAGEAERIVSVLARERLGVQRAIDRGARVTATVARRRAELGATLERLPPLLAEARPALDRLRAFMADGVPVLDALRAAAPAVATLARRAGPLADAAAPALARLGRAARTGGPVLRRAAPVVRLLRRFAREARPTGTLVAELFDSLRAKGVVEGLQGFVFYAAQATARFDRYSHIIPAHLIGSECSAWARTTVPECSAHFARGGARAQERRRRRAARRGRAGGRAGSAGRAPRGPGAAGGREHDGSDGGAPPLAPAPPSGGSLVPGLPDLSPLPRLPDPGGVVDGAAPGALGGAAPRGRAAGASTDTPRRRAAPRGRVARRGDRDALLELLLG
ncbi:MAG TPA: MlaD family protein [Solirubrobacteraceae bacterium]|nr:MlaD family protein [Solirubrobacteraceae bacterium]